MSDPQVAVLMLSIFIFTILLGFPIAFTLVAMGVGFGYYAYYDAARMSSIFDNRVFDLLVNQTYSVMASDVLTAVPLFLFMGYIVERANIVDRLFVTLQIAMRRLPGSMAIAALATSALFATATGIVGAVVTLMGLLAFPAMLKARYDTSFAAGVICAGGCLGILIPPSIMLIVYSAASNVSVVKLYAGAILPGFLLVGLYIIYVIGRAWLNPSLAPKPRPEDIEEMSTGRVMVMMATSFFPLAFLILSVLGSILFGLATPSEAAAVGAVGGLVLAAGYRMGGVRAGSIDPGWPELRRPNDTGLSTVVRSWLQAIGIGGILTAFGYVVYLVTRLVLHATGVYLMSDERPLPLVAGAAVIIALLVAICVHSFGNRIPVLNRILPRSRQALLMAEFAGKGALGGLVLGAFYFVLMGPLGVGQYFAEHEATPWGLDVGFFLGLFAYFAVRITDQDRLRESVYLTVRTAAMVSWLFVGSWTFASVFSYLGGHTVIREFVLALELSPIMFLILAQLIIFFLGWPLEWSEIIIIFVPIFLPMLPIFGIDPLFFGILVALNLQTSFLTPPMAMAAFYLKGVAPPHVQLVQIFKGVLPFLSMVILAMVILYIFPEIALGLPNYLYGS